MTTVMEKENNINILRDKVDFLLSHSTDILSRLSNARYKKHTENELLDFLLRDSPYTHFALYFENLAENESIQYDEFVTIIYRTCEIISDNQLLEENAKELSDKLRKYLSFINNNSNRILISKYINIESSEVQEKKQYIKK